MTTYSSGELTAILIQLIIVLVIVRRSFSMVRGVQYSGVRLVLVPVLILVLWGVSELESTLLIPWAFPYLIALDVAILIGALLGVARVAERMTQVYRDASGGWSYRIGFSLAGLFMGVFVVRLSLAAALFPSALVFGAPPGGFPPVQQQIVLALVDGLFSASVGLLIGRSLGVYRRWQAVLASPP